MKTIKTSPKERVIYDDGHTKIYFGWRVQEKKEFKPFPVTTDGEEIPMGGAKFIEE